MARPERKRRSRKAAGRRTPAAAHTNPRREELNESSRALLGDDRDARPSTPLRSDASVEDPLGDWPDD